jgi:hypothetical protein
MSSKHTFTRNLKTNFEVGLMMHQCCTALLPVLKQRIAFWEGPSQVREEEEQMGGK